MAPGRERLDALTGLRFIAAAGVMAFHYWHDTSGPMGRSSFVAAGFTGVSLFFILSGFVLGYNYLDRAESIRPLSFYWARFARVYPVYVLGALLVLVYKWRGQGPFIAVPDFVFYLPLVQAWSGHHALDGNGAGWSLSVEAFFYALFPLLAIRFAKLDSAGAFKTLLWSSVIVVIPQLFACVFVVPRSGLNTNDDLSSLFKFYPLLHLPEFTAGIALARLHGVWKPRGFPLRADLLVCISIFLVWLLAASPWKMPWPLTFTGGLILPFCLLIHGLSEHQGATVKLLSTRPLILLGESSYALYIIHIPVYLFLVKFLKGNLIELSIASIVLSIIVHLALERPARERLMRLQRRNFGPAVVSGEPSR